MNNTQVKIRRSDIEKSAEIDKIICGLSEQDQDVANERFSILIDEDTTKEEKDAAMYVLLGLLND